MTEIARLTKKIDDLHKMADHLTTQALRVYELQIRLKEQADALLRAQAGRATGTSKPALRLS